MIVYISGPMRGYEQRNCKAFYEAERELSAQGYKVLNPARLPGDLPEDRYMPICIAMIEASDAVCMLTGWKESKGAMAEWSYARVQNKIIFCEGRRKIAPQKESDARKAAAGAGRPAEIRVDREEKRMKRACRCKSCGRKIIFIESRKGKKIPCDPFEVSFIPDRKGSDSVVMADGSVMKGRICEDGSHRGLVSHFATCEAADDFRRR